MMMFSSSLLKRRAWLAAALCGVAVSMTGAPVAQAQPTSTPPKPVLVDAIVVVVNNDVITYSELQKRLQQVEQKLRSQGKATPSSAVLKQKVLEQMVIDRIQTQKAKSKGIRIHDTMLDRTITRIAAQNNLSVQVLRSNLERDGVHFADFREQIRKEIITRRLREREVDNKVQVMDSEIDHYLASVGGAPSQEEMNLGHILIRIPENASPEQIAERRKRTERVLKQLQSGKEFGQIALSYSEASGALEGGELGWRKVDQLPKIFADAVAKLGQGEISAIVKSPNGFHILKVVGKRHAKSGLKVPPVQQTHARHILIKVNQLVTAEDAKRKLLEIKQRLENKAGTFDELARLFSNDLSASKGGDLGWIYPGDTVPEFERAMMALELGQVSDPVQTPFGFHLIEVLERKMDEASQERLRMAVRKAIRERKIAEATESWLRQLRDSAYVKYRTNEL